MEDSCLLLRHVDDEHLVNPEDFCLHRQLAASISFNSHRYKCPISADDAMV